MERKKYKRSVLGIGNGLLSTLDLKVLPVKVSRSEKRTPFKVSHVIHPTASRGPATAAPTGVSFVPHRGEHSKVPEDGGVGTFDQVLPAGDRQICRRRAADKVLGTAITSSQYTPALKRQQLASGGHWRLDDRRLRPLEACISGPSPNSCYVASRGSLSSFGLLSRRKMTTNIMQN